ncbi:MAG: hypothetical protein WC044_01930 [Crocinitomicaceae bacterium]
MSSKVNDFLHELIHSLSKSEKRYFKLLSSRHTIGEENNYIVLFDYIESQDQYDEPTLIRHFSGQAFLNKLSITKKRLYNHILGALDNFHAQANVESQIFKMIHSAEILSQKSLYDQSIKILLSAEKLAKKNDYTNLLIHIRSKIKALIEKNNYLDIQSVELQFILDTDQELLAQSREEITLWNLKSHLFQHMAFHGIARTQEEKTKYEAFYLKYLEAPVTEKSSAESNYLALHLQSAYFFSVQDSANSLLKLQENLSLFQQDERLMKKFPERYFSILSNLIYTTESLNQTKASDDYLTELKRFENEIQSQSNDIDLQLKLFTTVASIEISSLTRKGEFQKALHQLPELEKGLLKNRDKISPIRNAFLHYKMATVYLSTGKVLLAQKEVRKILNDTELDKKEDIVAFSHLLELFIQIETGDMEFLNYSCRSAKRFLSSRKRMYGMEQELLSFAQKYISVKNTFDAEERWQKLYAKLSNLAKDPYQASALEYFDFLTWALAKANNGSFEQLSKEKFNKGFSSAA